MALAVAAGVVSPYPTAAWFYSVVRIVAIVVMGVVLVVVQPVDAC